MIDSNRYITDAQLANAYNGARSVRISRVDEDGHIDALRAVAEFAMAAFVQPEKKKDPELYGRVVVATSVPANDGGYPITAFCADGTVWRQTADSWKRCTSIPKL